MKSHRITIYIGALMAAAAVLPGSAVASPLLSGYGGPGQGNQALLGSTLINGPKGGGGSSGSTTSTGTGLAESGESSSEGGQASAGGSGSSKGGGTGSSSAPHANSGHGAAKPAQGKASTPAVAPSFYPAAERLPADSQGGSLGLSGSDVLLIVLAAVLLVSLGLLTRRAGGSGERQSTGG
ncbi:MAG TPA: hypothetical protein VHT25_09545 [Solirubrobacteraceae bacterium]|jgi:hypothetical protein|nr:hypothetical protein [Solirubrobacteraceae bacterium]